MKRTRNRYEDKLQLEKEKLQNSMRYGSQEKKTSQKNYSNLNIDLESFKVRNKQQQLKEALTQIIQAKQTTLKEENLMKRLQENETVK